MKLNSPLFNRIRVKPEPERKPRGHAPVCQWPGCACEATHRAPKGRMRENEYWRFCLEHMREYNSSYNYFAGMSDDAVARYQKDAVIGHRPTWKMGFNGGVDRFTARERRTIRSTCCASSVRGRGARRHGETRAGGAADAQRRAQGVRHAGSGDRCGAAEIKARFKELVKRHHPDANGGDRSTEDRLVEIIQAYNYLKSREVLLSGGYWRGKPCVGNAAQIHVYDLCVTVYTH